MKIKYTILIALLSFIMYFIIGLNIPNTVLGDFISNFLGNLPIVGTISSMFDVYSLWILAKSNNPSLTLLYNFVPFIVTSFLIEYCPFLYTSNDDEISFKSILVKTMLCFLLTVLVKYFILKPFWDLLNNSINKIHYLMNNIFSNTTIN